MKVNISFDYELEVDEVENLAKKAANEYVKSKQFKKLVNNSVIEILENFMGDVDMENMIMDVISEDVISPLAKDFSNFIRERNK